MNYVDAVVEGEGLAKMKLGNATNSELDKPVFTWFVKNTERRNPVSRSHHQCPGREMSSAVTS